MATLFRPRHRKSFYHRASVPRKLQRFFKGRTQLWRSLSTNDTDDAIVKSAQWDARTKHLFVTLKKHGARMSPEQIEVLIERWMNAELETSEDYRATNYMSEDYREGVGLVLIHQQEEVAAALISGDYKTIAPEADALLGAAGLPALDHKSVEFGRLCRRMLVAREDVLRVESQRWDGVYTRSAQTLPTALSPPLPTVTVQPTGPLFSEVVTKYVAENPRPPRLQDPLLVEFDRFKEVVGDVPMSSITKANARRYKEALQLRKIGLATQTKHLSSVSGLFRWAERNGYCEVNPVRGLAPDNKQTKRQALKIRPFTDAELLTVFGSQEFLKQRVKHPARYWVTLIALFTAARREEIGQLALADVQEVDGILSLSLANLEDTAQGSRKNDGSRRTIPVHSSLVELGFVQYVASIRKAGHTDLFPQLSTERPGQRSDAVGKAFARLMDKVGLSDPCLVFHSLRHTSIHRLHVAGCEQRLVEMLTGHAPANVHGRYEHRSLTPMSQLQDGLEKLRYEGVVKALTGQDQRTGPQLLH